MTTELPQPIPSRYYHQLRDALDKCCVASERFDESFTHYGPDSVAYAQDRARCLSAHGELMSAITDFLGHTTDTPVLTGVPTPPSSTHLPPQLATTDWVREYVAKQLLKQPTPWWELPLSIFLGVLLASPFIALLVWFFLPWFSILLRL